MHKFNQPGDIHFVTFRTHYNYPYFKDKKNCSILLEELDFYGNKLNLKIYGYVILPDHFHCLIYFKSEKLTISKVMQSIKGASARRIIDLYISSGSQEHPLLTRLEQMLQTTPRERKLGGMKQRLHAIPKGHRRGLKFRIWQPGFYDFNIYTNKKFWEKLDYIHKNPIKHKLTDNIANYKYCSLRNYELNDHSIFKIDYRED